MIIEITGTGTKNKGAELLFCAIKTKLGFSTKVKLAVTPEFGSYESRAHYGLLQKIESHHWTLSRLALSLLSSSFRSNYGLVKESDISAIVDASGFAFSDQLPYKRIKQFADCCKQWKSQNKTIILLPQALGPFEKQEFKTAFQEIVKYVDLIFARDTDSYNFAIQASSNNTSNIFKSPDITIDIEGDTSSSQDLDKGDILLVPNSRMLDRTHQDDAKIYPSFLGQCADICRSEQLTPKILIHDTGEDDQLIDLVQQQTKTKLEVIHESDPVKLKGILKKAHLVIGSRYHALTGALSSGIPSLAAGWSHKYQHLFEDFQCPEMLVNLHITPDRLAEKIRTLSNDRDKRSEHLLKRSIQLKAELSNLWEKVFGTLGISLKS